jgi:Membrane protein involved in the export of O-antigen and teichoic acid
MKKDNFLRGAFVATLCIVLTKILGVIYVIPFYSIVGRDGSVIYGAAYNIYAIFLNLSTIGLPLAISKMVSEYNTLGYEYIKIRTYKLAGKVMIISSILTTILLLLFAPFLAKYIINFYDFSSLGAPSGMVLMAEANVMHGAYLIQEIAFVIRISATAIFFVTLISMIRGYLQGMKYIQASSISQVIEQFVRVIIILAGAYLCMNVFRTSLGVAVGIAVFGATLGAIAAFIYLRKKQKQIPEDINYKITEEEKKITTKELFKKIITYTIPLIVMELIGTSFQLVDMFTVVTTLTNVGNYTLSDASFIMNAVTTLGTKLNVIVMAVANGLVVSLLPSLTSDYVEGNLTEVRKKINKTLQILMYITVPMAVGLSLLAEPVWTIFYGPSDLGSKVFMVSIFVAVFGSIFTNVVVTMQSLSRYKKMYIALFSGFIFNAIMNIPFMILFHKIGLPIYYGNLVATMIGYGITIFICLSDLKKTFQINYSRTIKRTIVILFATSIMILVIKLTGLIIPIGGHSRLVSILITGLYAVIGMAVYFGITFKTKTFDRIIGKEFILDIVKKRNNK